MPWRAEPPQVAMLRLAGVIAPQPGLTRGALNIGGLAASIERAFALKPLTAVALAINSPGGSPAQSALIAARIRQFAEEKKVPVLAFVEDVAASGGYWLATAADEIIATEASIVGSIGVISASFGFHELLKRFGVERRLYTAGERKSLLDPFLAQDPADVERLKAVQRELHELFKEQVRRRRADRLKAPEAELFSGEFWVGRRALALGLIDGIGELRGTLRQRFGEKVRLRLVGRERSWLRRRLGFADGGTDPWTTAASAAAQLAAAFEARALWARYGL